MLIGIIGYGFVGKATELLMGKDISVYVYDIISELCNPKNIKYEDLIECDIVFICLPTPMNNDSSCYIKIIEDNIKKLKELKYNNIIIRSTVPINFCKKNNVYFMPEFLTELNWKEDFIENKKWILGLIDNEEMNKNIKEKFEELINRAYKNDSIKHKEIIYVKNNEAELIKLVKNTYLGCKVGYFNEIYDICEKMGINYNEIIKVIEEDERIGKTHMRVPGYNNKRGYGGTCFPKDMNNLYKIMNEENIKSYYIKTSLERNEYKDRIERDWLLDKKRAVINNEKKIILVTGGAGFIGSNLCERLIKDKNNIVICLDNLSSGLESNINELKKEGNFIFMKHDIKNKMFFPKIDMIYHLACPASPPFYQKDGIKTIKTSVIGMLNILKLCKIHKCKMLFTSTSEIYGDPLEHPQKETYWGNVNPIGPRSCYDEGKRICETMIYEYRKKYNLDLKIVRIFNTYGPKMRLDDGRVITNYIKSIKNNESITIYGDGNQTRSFCYIDDMIEGIIKMMESQENGPVNLGNPEEFTMNELFNIFSKILNKKLIAEYKDLPKDDPKQRRPDISLAIEKLNWHPEIKLNDGIKILLKSFLNN